MVNWINSWKSGNKKRKYNITVRLGKITVFELELNLSFKIEGRKFRIMLLNFGFEF